MKRVLVYYPKNKFSMTDFDTVDYSRIPQIVKNEFNGKFPNVGNKVWLQAIVSAITTDYCSYDFGYEDLTEDYINANYDCVLMPLANCFHKGWIPWMERRTGHIKKLKIPVYVIACGVQADSYDDLDDLICSCREPAYNFIKAVYNSGGGTGQWALRGFFTNDFFRKLGFNDAVVTGCPSLYQMGRNLSISNEIIDRDHFIATINGTFDLPINEKDINECSFIDQGSYGNLLYDPSYFETHNYSFKRVVKLLRRGKQRELKAIVDNRIECFADTQEWMSYYVNNHVSFSFGSRIHGTVMPILSGVKSLLYSTDARTREMAEFFDIPYTTDKSQRSLYDLYLETDYSKFNEKFSQRFDAFEKFLVSCGLVEKANQDNIFMKRNQQSVVFPNHVNIDGIKTISKKLHLAQPLVRAFQLINK